MSMHNRIKPLIHWVIARGYKVRFTARAANLVKGVLTTADGEIAFQYDPVVRLVYLPDMHIAINEYGWELRTEQADSP